MEYERKFDGAWQAGWSALGISRRKCSHTFAGVSSPWQGFSVKMNVLGEGWLEVAEFFKILARISKILFLKISILLRKQTWLLLALCPDWNTRARSFTLAFYLLKYYIEILLQSSPLLSHKYPSQVEDGEGSQLGAPALLISDCPRPAYNAFTLRFLNGPQCNALSTVCPNQLVRGTSRDTPKACHYDDVLPATKGTDVWMTNVFFHWFHTGEKKISTPPTNTGILN